MKIIGELYKFIKLRFGFDRFYVFNVNLLIGREILPNSILMPQSGNVKI